MNRVENKVGKFCTKNTIPMLPYKEYNKQSSDLYVYERVYNGVSMLVICSYTDKCVNFTAPACYDLTKGKAILCNYKDAPVGKNGFTTRPYETRVYLFD